MYCFIGGIRKIIEGQIEDNYLPWSKCGYDDFKKLHHQYIKWSLAERSKYTNDPLAGYLTSFSNFILLNHIIREKKLAYPVIMPGGAKNVFIENYRLGWSMKKMGHYGSPIVKRYFFKRCGTIRLRKKFDYSKFNMQVRERQAKAYKLYHEYCDEFFTEISRSREYLMDFVKFKFNEDIFDEYLLKLYLILNY